MALHLNNSAVSKAEAAIRRGDIDHSEWNAPEGSARTADECLGIDESAEPSGQHKYPIFSGSKVNRKALGSAMAYAETNGETEIYAACQKLAKLADEHKEVKSMGRMFYLSTSNVPLEPAVTLGQGLPNQIDGQPVKYFWGKGAKIGAVYSPPGLNWKLPADKPAVQGWIKNFSRMQENGIKVPVLAKHVKKGEYIDAKNSLGYMVGARISDGWMQPLLQLIGEDAIRMASRNEISIAVDPDYEDSLNNEYGEAIIHVALTPDPVVPGQGGLKAASRHADASEPVIFAMSLNGAENPKKVSPKMDTDSMNCSISPEDVEYVKGAYMADGGKEDADKVTPPNAFGMLKAHHMKLMAKHVKMASRVTELEPVATEAETLRAEVKNLSATQPKKLDPEIAFERRQRGRLFVDKLKEVGYSAADADDLGAMLLGTEKSPNMYALSRLGDEDCLAVQILKKLAQCVPAPKTGQAAFLMSRSTDSSQPSNPAEDKKKEALAWWGAKPAAQAQA